MAQVTLIPDGIESTGTWTSFTVSNLSTSDNVYADSAPDNSSFTPGVVTLSAAPTMATFNSATFHVEASYSGSGRTKRVTVELLNSSNTVISSFTSDNLGTSDVTYNSSTVTGSYTKSDIDGWKIRVTAVEDGGMPGNAFVRIDRIWLSLDYDPGDTTPPAAPTNFSVTSSTSGPILEWDNPSASDLHTIRIERSLNGSTGWSEINVVSSPTPSAVNVQWQDTTGTMGTTYYYRIRAADIVPNYSGYTSVLSGQFITPHYTGSGGVSLSSTPQLSGLGAFEIFYTGNGSVVINPTPSLAGTGTFEIFYTANGDISVSSTPSITGSVTYYPPVTGVGSIIVASTPNISGNGTVIQPVVGEGSIEFNANPVLSADGTFTHVYNGTANIVLSGTPELSGSGNLSIHYNATGSLVITPNIQVAGEGLFFNPPEDSVLIGISSISGITSITIS